MVQITYPTEVSKLPYQSIIDIGWVLFGWESMYVGDNIWVNTILNHIDSQFICFHLHEWALDGL